MRGRGRLGQRDPCYGEPHREGVYSMWGWAYVLQGLDGDDYGAIHRLLPSLSGIQTRTPSPGATSTKGDSIPGNTAVHLPAPEVRARPLGIPAVETILLRVLWAHDISIGCRIEVFTFNYG